MELKLYTILHIYQSWIEIHVLHMFGSCIDFIRHENELINMLTWEMRRVCFDLCSLHAAIGDNVVLAVSQREWK